MVYVSDLISYPVKGCAGVSLRSSLVEPTGLRHDRTFMVVDERDSFRSQRNDPSMARIRPTVLDDGAQLALSAPGAKDLVIDVCPLGARRRVTVWRSKVIAADQGEPAARWLSAVLGVTCRLVAIAPEHSRTSVGEHEGTVGFADGHALLIASDASLDELNARILERGASPVPMDRFRPNIVLRGWPVPHTEDRVHRMVIGEAEFGYAKICVRCSVPMVDQATGRSDGPEPIRTLATYRRNPEGGVTFGMKAAVLRTGRVTVGDAVACEWRVLL
ncbi:MAG: MOSC domain-containing protein [Pseudonocardia sp.]|nr:MOSC domain-containing protein [Pseudonocardia sp.]